MAPPRQANPRRKATKVVDPMVDDDDDGEESAGEDGDGGDSDDEYRGD